MRWFLAMALAACASDPAVDPATLQMNDLAILFPLGQDPRFAFSAPGRGGVLVPDALVTAATDFQTPSQFTITAMRLDPCFGQLGDAPCDAQLRLVFQPMMPGTETRVDDVGVHAFYSLTQDELLAAIREITAARGTADLGPLAVHPLLAQQGTGGAFATTLSHVISTYAGQGNLVRLNAFSIVEDTKPIETRQQWAFTSADISAGTVSPHLIPGMTASRLDATVELAQFTTTIDPVATIMDSVGNIENPHVQTPNTIDCASCHFAQPSHELGGVPVGDAFEAAGIPAADLASTTHLIDPNDQGLNIHAFSYRFTQPMINQRTINETANNIAYLGPLLRE
ncbi:MAG: hypothetical protein QM831_29245 [Kofleriaceae bacterium]